MSNRQPVTVEEYLNNDEMCVSVVKKKYLKLENQLVSDCFDTVITNSCTVTTEPDIVERTQFIDAVYDDWINGIWLGAGSIMSGANEINRKVSIANCSTIVIPEDTIESILDTKKYATKMAAHRQGFGVHFDVIRPRYSPINNSAEISEGAVHWMKSFDKIGEDAGQKSRKPAMLYSLSVKHLDVEEFITCKKDIDAINNANISVHITNEFMECVKNNGTWHQTFTFNDGSTIEKDVDARKLFNLMCENAWETGEPGLQFIDKMKSWSIQEALGHKIKGSNACGEKPMPDQSICCLAPLNMEKVPNPFTEPEAFHKFMESKVRNMVRFMDNIIQFELDHPYKSPTQKQYDTVQDLREIGLGILNLHAWLFNNNVAYDSEAAVEYVDEFFKWYQYYAFKSSCKLAIDRGPCPAWQKCADADTLLSLETPFLAHLFHTFPDLAKMYYQTGIRNGALISIAPTGSISMFFPNFLSTGIEPLIGYAYWRKTRALSVDQNVYDHFFVLNSVIKGMILPKVTDAADHDYLANLPASVLDNDGKIGIKAMDIIKKYVDVNLIKPAHEIDPFMKVKLMAACQKWNDAAISVTYNLANNFKVEEVEKLYEAAYDNGLKSIAIYRDGSRQGIYIFEDPITYKAKFAKELKNPIRCDEKHRPTDIVYHCAPKRPESLPCDIHHCTVKGEQWIVLVGMLNGNPYELFAGMKNEDFNISKTVKDGVIIKRPKGYTLRINTRNSYIEYNDVTQLFMNEEFKALTRMISLALRTGAYHEYIVGQLRKSSEFIGDFMAVVSRVLNRYIKDGTSIASIKCPHCGTELIDHGGCKECPNPECLFSRCE